MNEFIGREKWISLLEENLAHIHSKKLTRTLKTHFSNAVDFSSNDYLSLNTDGTILSLLRKSMQEWEMGKYSSFIGSTASRLIRGEYEIFRELEEYFSKKLGYEASLYFGSGYSANVSTLTTLLDSRDFVFCDRLIHASLIDGIRFSGAKKIYFSHNDLNDLEKKLKLENLHRKARSQFWIIAESLYSMDGDSPNLVSLCQIAQREHACIYLDEAHAIGVYGDKGLGLAKIKEQDVLEYLAVGVYPCGKALGLMGAFVCGPKSLRNILINKARPFIFSTSPPPLIAHLLFKIIQLVFSEEMESKRKKLKSLADYAHVQCKQYGLRKIPSSSHVIALLTGSEKGALELSEHCINTGFDVRAIRPPSVPHGQSRLRVCLHSCNTQVEVDTLIKRLIEKSELCTN